MKRLVLTVAVLGLMACKKGEEATPATPAADTTAVAAPMSDTMQMMGDTSKMMGDTSKMD